jgi:hypothetical protein
LLFTTKKIINSKSKKQCAVVRWLTKTMTKNNRVGGEAFFYSFFVRWWVGHQLIGWQKEHLFFYSLLS